jgi:Flp pilus assembly protein TadD
LAEGIIPAGIEPEKAESTRLSADLAASHALDHAMHDPEGQKAAAAFLTSHKHFIDLQIAGYEEEQTATRRATSVKHVSDILRVLAQIAFVIVGIAFAAGVGTMWWRAALSHSVIVAPFDAPQSLSWDGLSGRVVAGKVLDVLLAMQDATRLAAARRQITDAWSESVEVEVPETGISLGQINDALHRMFGHDVHIDGALITTPSGTLVLSVRGDDIPPARFQGTEANIDDLARKAAEYLFSRAEPDLYATYLLDSGREEDALAFIRDSFTGLTEAERPALANLWGEALLSQNKVAESTEKYLLALSIDPHYWRAWNNLVGTLPATAGEEAAYRAGIAMQRAARGVIFDAGPTLYDGANFAQLTMNAQAVIAGLLADRSVAEREGAEYDSSSWIAEQQAVLHNWGKVIQYLAESPASDVTTAYDGYALAGQQAVENGQYRTAVRLLLNADRIWKVQPTLQAFFPDFECKLGYAIAAAGAPAAAWPLFRAQNYVRCRAFLADTLDLEGKWAEAELAYRSAEAVAPSLAFAYEREGVAFLRHGDSAGAIARLRIAHRLSPYWADPLKDWGDALAAERRPGAALRRYRQALALAPKWVALQEAKSALEQAASR